MNATQLPFSKRMFRALLRVLPADFRSDYGREMEHAFDDQEREARDRSGAVGVVRVWWETLAGIFTTAPREHWEMLQQDTDTLCGRCARISDSRALRSLRLRSGSERTRRSSAWCTECC